jgi:hypothetical protein
LNPNIVWWVCVEQFSRCGSDNLWLEHGQGVLGWSG